MQVCKFLVTCVRVRMGYFMMRLKRMDIPMHLGEDWDVIPGWCLVNHGMHLDEDWNVPLHMLYN